MVKIEHTFIGKDPVCVRAGSVEDESGMSILSVKKFWCVYV